MKFHNLHITTKNIETYQKVTSLLGVIPALETEDCNLWTYQVVTDEHNDYFDFINVFLELLEPNFERLKILGIDKEDILFWLFYEYDQQCAMGFSAKELKRLGESGISLNVDCIQKKNQTL